MRQKKILTNLGKDTHVRDHSQNIFQRMNNNTYQMLVGEVEETQPEPIFVQNTVNVRLADGDKITSVAYPGAFIDPESGNLHGTYEGPIPGQMVVVGFENGNMNSPLVVNRYPYQGHGNTNVEADYKTPLTNASFNPSDVMIGHHSGSFLVFNEGSPLTENGNPGSVKLYASTEFLLVSDSEILIEAETSAEINTKKIILTGSDQIELNGNSNYAVLYTEMKSAFDQLKADFDDFVSTVYGVHIHITTATVGIGPPGVIAPTTSIGTPSTADMSSAKNDTVLM